MNILDTIWGYLLDSGFGQFHWSNLVMIGVGCLFLFLAIRKGFEPLLLVPIGFGILLGNVPYDASKLPLGVYDGPVSEHDLSYYAVRFATIDPEGPQGPTPFDEFLTDAGIERLDHETLMGLIYNSEAIEFAAPPVLIESHVQGRAAVEAGEAVIANSHSVLSASGRIEENQIIPFRQGRYLFVPPNPGIDLRNTPAATEGSEEARLQQFQIWHNGNRFPELWSLAKQDPQKASVLWYLFVGVGIGGFFPPLIFLGIGALTDFGPMLSNPKTLLLGAAAQFGIFGALLGALALGFTPKEAASIGIIGGADGPTAIFTCSQLAPDLLGAVALAAYSYMAMVPIIQPPIIKLLTTREERLIRMNEGNPVAKRVKIIFPILGFIITAFIAPAGLPLLGMLFFGNLLRESMVTDRLSRTAQNQLIDIVTILLGVTVGAKTSAANFLTWQTIYVFILGVLAFGFATAAGVIFGKIMNWLVKEPINPMIGAAGVSAVPMSARVVHRLGLAEDKQNFLLMHAMGPNVAGVIGSAVAAGVLLSNLAGT